MNKRLKVITIGIIATAFIGTSFLILNNKNNIEVVYEKEGNKQIVLEVEGNKEVADNSTKDVLVVENTEEVNNKENSETLDKENVNKENVNKETEIIEEESDRPVIRDVVDNTSNNISQDNKDKELNNTSNFISEIEGEIFNIVNAERAKAGVAALQYSSTMQHYGRIKSEDMAVNEYFEHTDLNGQLITTKMDNDGVAYSAWGENIAYIGGDSSNYQHLAKEFMNNWMNSDGHRKNILSTNFTGIGVGVYKVGNTYYATQEFNR